MRRNTISLLWLAALLSATCSLCAQPASKAMHAAKGDSFLSGAPFTLDQVIRIIDQDAIPLRRRKEAIQNRGVDFAMSPATVARLKAAGTPEEILEVIKSKAKPLPAPEPPKPPARGSINISCAPAECEVALNGTALGSTSKGALELHEVTPGSYVVDITRTGYLSRQNTVVVEADKTLAISATLDPTRETEEGFGAALFQKMIQALGGEDGLKDLSAVQAAGSATVVTNDGRSIRWALRMRSRGEHSLFQAKSGVLTYEVLFTGSQFTAGKNLNGHDALELPTAFGFFRDNQVAALIARLDKQQYKMVAPQAQAADGAEFALTAESGTDKIQIGLDQDLRPQRVHITTETGVGSLLITYSDYAQVGHAWFPKSMQVKPDNQQRGAEFHFDTVEADTKSKDSDFKLKSKLFATLYN